MARHPFLSIQAQRDAWGDEPYFLDPFALAAWLRFLRGEPAISDAARDGRFHVVVFKDFLAQLTAPDRKTLKQFCEVDASSIKAGERWMVDEMLSLVFRDDSSYRQRAELLVLARRRRQGQKLLLLSNCQRLFSLPNAQTFFWADLEKSADFPVGFDLALDFQFHPRLRDATQSTLESGHFSQAVQAGVVALCKEVGKAFPAATGAEGLAQMEEVFACVNSRNAANRRAPRLAINDLASDSDWNEALGYSKLFAGAPTALRNPAAHEEPDGQWLQERFGDKITVTKTLCFLSLLFEKLEKRPL